MITILLHVHVIEIQNAKSGSFSTPELLCLFDNSVIMGVGYLTLITTRATSSVYYAGIRDLLSETYSHIPLRHPGRVYSWNGESTSLPRYWYRTLT